MNRIYPLFSSSKGNCTYIGNEKRGLLIDAGVSCKRICAALADNGISPEAIGGILITHTHSDHIKGLAVFAKKYRIPIYAQTTNLDILIGKNAVPEGAEVFSVDGAGFTVGDFAAQAFETPHDTPASCGYRITAPDGHVAVVCTDLGRVTETVDLHLKAADVVLLESNYDEKMLINGSYSYDLKMRIASNFGHLSNSACGEQLKKLLKNGTQKFILGHLSQENNTPEKAMQSAVCALDETASQADYILKIARPEGVGTAVEF